MKNVLCSLLTFCLMTVGAGVLTVTDVVATPRYPWNGKVDVAFTLNYTNAAERLYVTLGALDGGENTSLPVRTLLVNGEMEKSVCCKGVDYVRFTPGRHTLTWDADQDAPGLLVTSLVCSVTAKELLHVVEFDANDGRAVLNSRVVRCGEAIGELSSPTRTGYDFAGWFTASEGGTAVTASSVVSDDVTCYAHWNVRNYRVSFEGRDGVSRYVYRNYNEKLGSLPVMSNPDRAFAGWYTLSGEKATESTVVTGATTYYAKWSCTVTFNGNGGIVYTQIGSYTFINQPTMSVSRSYGDSLGALPLARRSGYRFDCWCTVASGTFADYANSMVTSSTAVYKHMTCYARWIKE